MLDSERGVSRRQTSIASGQRGWKAQPARRVDRRGRLADQRTRWRLARRDRRSASPPSARAYRGAAGPRTAPPWRRSRPRGRDRSPSPRRRYGARPRDRGRRTRKPADAPPAVRRAGSAPARGWRCRAPTPARRARESSGFSISARAMAMRWRWPPENMCGIAVIDTRAAAPPRASCRAPPRRARRPSRSVLTSSGSSSALPIFWRGLSEP